MNASPRAGGGGPLVAPAVTTCCQTTVYSTVVCPSRWGSRLGRCDFLADLGEAPPLGYWRQELFVHTVLSGDREGLGQGRLRAVAGVDVDLTGFDHEPSHVVVEADVAAVERERDSLGLAGCQGDAFKGAQPADRLGDARHRVVDV